MHYGVYLLLPLAASFAAGAQLLFKTLAADGYIALISLKGLIAFSFYGLGFLMFYTCLHYLPLHIAYQFAVLTYILVNLGAFFLLQEKINSIQLVAIGVIAFGMVLLFSGSSGGDT